MDDLYADLPPDALGTASSGKSSTATPVWQAQANMLAARRNAAAAAARQAASKSAGTIERPALKPIAPPVISSSKNNSNNSSNLQAVDEGFQDQDVHDLYDPARPNDYMDFCKYRLRQQQQKEREKEIAKIMAEQEQERRAKEEERSEALRQHKEQLLAQQQQQQQQRQQPMPYSAPPPAAATAVAAPAGRGRGLGRGVSNLPAWMTKQQQPGSEGGPAATADRPLAPPDRYDDAAPAASGAAAAAAAAVANVGAQLLGRMGWQEGQGLGRDNQGISRPIIAQATGSGTGTVSMHPADRQRASEEAARATSSSSSSTSSGSSISSAAVPQRKRGLFSNPTCVLLLKVRCARCVVVLLF
jgi:splicing factor 45